MILWARSVQFDFRQHIRLPRKPQREAVGALPFDTDIDDAEAAADPTDGGVRHAHQPVGNTRPVHQVAGEDEERDRHQRENADARRDPLDRDDRGNAHRREAAQRRRQQRKGHRHADRQQYEQHAEEDQEFHQALLSSAGTRPRTIRGIAKTVISSPAIGSGT